jgi:hypothetical protein
MKPDLDARMDQLIDDLTAAVNAARPADIPAGRIIERAEVIMLMIGRTRTSVMGAALYAATSAAMVGIPPAQLKQLIDDAYKLVAAQPEAAEAAARYEVDNATAKAAASTQLGGDSTPMNLMLMAPEPKLKM